MSLQRETSTGVLANFKRQFAKFQRELAIFKPILTGFDQLYPGNRRNLFTILRLTTEHIRHWPIFARLFKGDSFFFRVGRPRNPSSDPTPQGCVFSRKERSFEVPRKEGFRKEEDGGEGTKRRKKGGAKTGQDKNRGLSAVNQRGRENKGPPDSAPKSFSWKGPKSCSVPPIGVIGKSAFGLRAPDTFNFLRHIMRAISSVQPNCFHRCVSLKKPL